MLFISTKAGFVDEALVRQLVKVREPDDSFDHWDPFTWARGVGAWPDDSFDCRDLFTWARGLGHITPHGGRAGGRADGGGFVGPYTKRTHERRQRGHGMEAHRERRSPLGEGMGVARGRRGQVQARNTRDPGPMQHTGGQGTGDS